MISRCKRSLSVALSTVLLVAGIAAAGHSVASAASAPITAPPRPDHIVVVVEENRSSASVLGSPDAPYINYLAASAPT